MITGFRLGLGGAQARYDVTPDLTCFGKVIGGGLPIGAIGGSAAVMEHLSPLGPVFHAGTLAGNPLATAAGLAALDELTDDHYVELFARARRLGAGLRDALTAAGIAVQVPVLGTLVGIHLAAEPAYDYPGARTDRRGALRPTVPRPVAPRRGPRPRRLRGALPRLGTHRLGDRRDRRTCPLGRARSRRRLMLAVAAFDLWKRYDDKVAVGGIGLSVPAGSFYGIVGPNGAGKTTTLRMLVGLLRPDNGYVTVAGVPVWPDPRAAKAIVGVLPDDLRLFERLSGAELLTYLGLLRGIERAEVDRRRSELLDTLGLADDAAVLVADYSTGMRKKIALAAAVLHGPRVLFLDEPFESVDPLSARTIVEVLSTFRRAGGTIVFSSHVMETVERLCDHVAILAGGLVVQAGTLDDVRAGRSLEDAFVAAVGAPLHDGGANLDWLGGSTA